MTSSPRSFTATTLSLAPLGPVGLAGIDPALMGYHYRSSK